jgi:hypothetical protein
MIQLNCTNCKALLTIDEAFAGGACRCRHCGTIQTVPKHLRENGDAVGSSGVLAQAASGAKAPKSLYKKRTAVAETPGTGLDDLAEIVASSGLSSSRLQKSNAPAAQPAPKDKRMVMLVSVAGGIIALLLGIIIFMAVRDRTNNEPLAGTTGGGSGEVQPTNPTVPAPTPNKPEKTPLVMKKPPHFLNQGLKGSSVVYVLDHGSSSSLEGRLNLLKSALINSLHSLGPERRFQVIFWNVVGQPVTAFPADGLAPATVENIAACEKFLGEIFPAGQTQAPIEKAFNSGAESVVLVPIKSDLLDDSLQKDLAKVRKQGMTANLYCLTIAQPSIASALKKIVAEAKGTYKDVSLQDARNSLAE